jgi:Ni/Co efflux regulator RcnB
MKRLLLATTALLLVIPDTAALAYQARNQMQPTRSARAGAQRSARPAAQRATRPERPARTTRVPRSSRQTVRTVRTVERPSGRTVRTVRSTTRFPTFRPGTRPSTFHRINVSPFRYPRGYRYRRFRAGLFLPRLFLSSAYFFNDYYDLGIGPPPRGYVWVRYGPDLLLVSRRTGRIVDVIYGAFY